MNSRLIGGLSCLVLAASALFSACGGGSSGDGMSPAASAPEITSQPSSVTATAGSTATFSVSASGTDPLSYQWKKNGTAITGATSTSYTTPTLQSSDNGATYLVVITNPEGSVTSSAATLTVSTQSGGGSTSSVDVV